MLRGMRLFRSIFALGLVVAAVTTFAPSPANADIQPLVAAPVRVSVTSASDSAAQKTQPVTCPAANPRVYGAGGDISGGFGDVVLVRAEPNAALTSVTVTAIENGAYAGNWSLQAWAICGPATAGLQRFPASTVSNQNTPKSTTATCPSPLRLYGTGFAIAGGVAGGGDGFVFLSALTPNSGLTSVTVRADEDIDQPYTQNWQVSVYAICANAAPTMQRVAAPGVNDSASPKSTDAICPAGTRAHGIGGEVNSAGFGNVVIDELEPGSSNVFTTNTVYENGTFGTNWFLTTYAVCSS